MGCLKVCRLCASSCKNSVSIFKRTGSSNLAEKIKSYLHVEIKNSNGADEPRMCRACHEKIVSWDRYAEQVQKVQEMFLSAAGMDFNSEVVDEFGDKPVETVNGVDGKGNESEEVAKVGAEESGFPRGDESSLSNRETTVSEGIQSIYKKKKVVKVKPKIKLKIKQLTGSKQPEDHDCKTELEKLEEKHQDCLEKPGTDSKDENKALAVQSLFTWECLECNTLVKNWNALVKHCKMAHDSSASVQCVCGKSLQSRPSITKHRMTHTLGYSYKCEFENCNKTFHRQHLLDIHSLSHMPKEQQPWMCCKCSRRFHTETLLKQHEKVHLPKEEKLIHPCEICQKKFCSKSSVTTHIRTIHFGERPFVCDQCGHSFTSKGILHEHLNIHSDEHNFHCKDCNKSFKTKYRLKIHMDTHVETKYQCPVCTLTLNTKRTLRMHLLVHTEHKAFQCTTCGKAFKRSKDLKNHYNLHTGRRPYSCPFCERTFTNGSNCRSHKRRMHPEELRIFEAVMAAGKQPVIRSSTAPDKSERNNSNLSDDPTDSKPNLKLEDKKYSDEEETKEVVSRQGNRGKGEVEGESELEGGERGIKEENEDEEVGRGEGKVVEPLGLSGGEGAGPNAPHKAFGSQDSRFPLHNFHSFHPNAIPAFPFFRQ